MIYYEDYIYILKFNEKIIINFVFNYFGGVLVSCTSDSNESENNEQIYAIYQLAVSNADFDGTYEEWLESVKGPVGEQGEAGREVSLQVSDGYIQWQYLGESDWINLIDLITLTGSNGADGIDGRDVLFQVADGFIQWKYTDSLIWTDLVALEIISGSNGNEVMFQVNNGYIQWQYLGDETWTNLIDLSMLTGADGIDGIDGVNGTNGREIILQVDGDMLQWKYDGDDSWTDLVIYNNISDSYYLTDQEINSILQNYADDIINLFPRIDVNTLNDIAYDNTCETDDYEICNSSDNYPMIFGEGYEKFVDKQNAIDLLVYAMTTISDLMGTYDSEPIVPNEYLSGTDALARVEGRNNTSILFEGNLDGSIPIDIPIDIQFTYQLLIYKSIEDNKIYVEGNINFTSGFLFLNLELSETSFISTYSMNLSLDNFVYTTDIVGFNEWVTIIQPAAMGVEIYSTNQESIEYFLTTGDHLEIMYSSNWFSDFPDYYYEIYNSDFLIYRLSSISDDLVYEIPMSLISGWSMVEFTNDSKIGDNDLSYRISNNGVTIFEDLADESQIAIESVWILSYDYKNYFNNLGELDNVNASNTIILRANSKTSMDAFLETKLTYNSDSNWDEYLLIVNQIENYTFLEYEENIMNFNNIYDKFNLRD
jgi:hypothetical protein